MLRGHVDARSGVDAKRENGRSEQWTVDTRKGESKTDEGTNG